MTRHKNARNVLPSPLLEQVQKHANGCYLWIPSVGRGKKMADRAAWIVEQYVHGMPVSEIAERSFLKRRTVYHILHKFKQR